MNLENETIEEKKTLQNKDWNTSGSFQLMSKPHANCVSTETSLIVCMQLSSPDVTDEPHSMIEWNIQMLGLDSVSVV